MSVIQKLIAGAIFTIIVAVVLVLIFGWRIVGFEVGGFLLQPPNTQPAVDAPSISTPAVIVVTPTPELLQPTYTQPQPTLSIIRPSPFHVVNGENYFIPGGWTWVCTGDFSTQLNDTKKGWYDVGVSNTGLVFVLQPDSSFTISGPFEVPIGASVGDCYPYAQNEKDSAVSSAVNKQFDKGCGSKCQYVNVIELDQVGNEVNNYWLPQKP